MAGLVHLCPAQLLALLALGLLLAPIGAVRAPARAPAAVIKAAPIAVEPRATVLDQVVVAVTPEAAPSAARTTGTGPLARGGGSCLRGSQLGWGGAGGGRGRWGGGGGKGSELLVQRRNLTLQ